MFKLEGQLVSSKRIRYELLSRGQGSWIKNRETQLMMYIGYIRRTTDRNEGAEMIKTKNVVMELEVPDHI